MNIATDLAGDADTCLRSAEELAALGVGLALLGERAETHARLGEESFDGASATAFRRASTLLGRDVSGPARAARGLARALHRHGTRLSEIRVVLRRARSEARAHGLEVTDVLILRPRDPELLSAFRTLADRVADARVVQAHAERALDAALASALVALGDPADPWQWGEVPEPGAPFRLPDRPDARPAVPALPPLPPLPIWPPPESGWPDGPGRADPGVIGRGADRGADRGDLPDPTGPTQAPEVTGGVLGLGARALGTLGLGAGLSAHAVLAGRDAATTVLPTEFAGTSQLRAGLLTSTALALDTAGDPELSAGPALEGGGAGPGAGGGEPPGPPPAPPDQSTLPARPGRLSEQP